MTNQDKYEVCEKVKNYLLNLFSFEEYGIPDPSICQIYITIVHPKKTNSILFNYIYLW